MNRDFEFKQLLRAYRAGIITEQTFESEMAALENGNGNGQARPGFQAMGKNYGSEREGVAALLDRFRAGEANGEAAFLAWEKLCKTDCIRSGIRMIAEREGYHARIFERRMRDLGVECKEQVPEASRKFTEYMSDPNVSDNQKLLYFNSLVPDVDTFFKPVCADRRRHQGRSREQGAVQAVCAGRNLNRKMAAICLCGAERGGPGRVRSDRRQVG